VRTSPDVWGAVKAASVVKLDRQNMSARLAHAGEPAEDADTPDYADPAPARTGKD